MISRSIALLVFVSGLLFAASAYAANGYTTGNVNMRTGPGVYYPRITVIPVASRVTIYHCTRSQRWCSVGWRGIRGWVSGRYLRFSYYRPRVYVPPPDIYFDFDFREPRWRDRHDRWHKSKPYPRRKKKIDRRHWNRDHDRWHQKNKVVKKRKFKKHKVFKKRKSGKRKCPPNRDCD